MGPNTKVLALINAVGDLEKMVKQQKEALTGFNEIGLADDEHAVNDDLLNVFIETKKSNN